MKLIGVLCVLAILGGSWLGYAAANRDFVKPEHRFGPFSESTTDAEAIIDKLLDDNSSGGRAQVEVLGGMDYDFGVMLRNSSSEHQFTLRNVGTGPLRLKVLGSTCKCTVGTLDREVLEPGDSTTVKLEWTAKTNTGHFSQAADIKTNDPENTVIKLAVSGQVIELIAAEPASWNVAQISGTSDFEVETTLYNHASEPVEITSVEWLDEEFAEHVETKWERGEVDPEGVHAGALEAFVLKSTIHAPLPQGLLSETLRLRYRTASGDEDHPPLDLPLGGEVVGDLSMMGGKYLVTNSQGVARLTMGRSEQGEVVERKAYVIFRGPLRNSAKLTITSVEPAAALEAEFEEPTERGTMKLYPLIVRTKADAPVMERAGKNADDFGHITIESDDPEVAPYRLTVLFRIGHPFDDR